MTSFREKIEAIMARRGVSYHAACRLLAGAGGRAAARNKRRRRAETERQQRMGLR